MIAPGPAERKAYERIRSLLYFDRYTGHLHWTETDERASQSVSKDAPKIVIDGAQMPAAHVVWLLQWGQFPPFKIKPGNGEKWGIRPENLMMTDPVNAVRGCGFHWQAYGCEFESYYAALAYRDVWDLI